MSHEVKGMRMFERRARTLLENAQLADLLEEWGMTANWRSPEVAQVRGWLMDELEKRNPEAFNAWLESDAEDIALKDYMTDKAYVS